jgi:membrane dipeptidase
VARRLTRAAAVTAGAVASAAALAGAVAIGGAASGIIERRRNRVLQPRPYRASPHSVELHRTLTVVDLHADSLIWGRDLLRRADYGHVDVPRLVEGGVALIGMAASTKVPRRANLDRNDDKTDDVTLLALAQRWPRATWGSPLARALHLALRLRSMAADSAGRLSIVESRVDLESYLARRAIDPTITAAFLAIEGAQALEDDLGNLDILATAGYRMLAPSHLFDTTYAGSAHGIVKGGLTSAGRDLLSRMESSGIVMDVTHASSAAIDDILSLAARPVVASHTGIRAATPGTRNLPDDQVRAIAATGGLVGMGFWPVATGGEDVAAIARSIVTAIELAGIEHVGLGSDFDGAVPAPFDATGMALVTEALLAEGLRETDVAAVMGGNAVRVLLGGLPS